MYVVGSSAQNNKTWNQVRVKKEESESDDMDRVFRGISRPEPKDSAIIVRIVCVLKFIQSGRL